jgi:hypothetical protein
LIRKRVSSASYFSDAWIWITNRLCRLKYYKANQTIARHEYLTRARHRIWVKELSDWYAQEAARINRSSNQGGLIAATCRRRRFKSVTASSTTPTLKKAGRPTPIEEAGAAR